MLKVTILCAAAFAAAPALAASPFDGTWKTDMSATQYSTKPRNILFKDGMYQCDCTPPVKIKADGQLHAVTGHPYIDEMSMKVVDGRHADSVVRKGGRTLDTDSYSLSPDGATLSVAYTDMSAPDGKPVKGVSTMKRVGPAPAGSLPMSGAYVKRNEATSDAALIQTFRLDGNVLHFSTPNGFGFDAPLDGKPVPIKGDPAGAMASVKRAGPRTIVETDLIGGKPQSVTTMTVRSDGRTADVSVQSTLSGRVTKYVIRKE